VMKVGGTRNPSGRMDETSRSQVIGKQREPGGGFGFQALIQADLRRLQRARQRDRNSERRNVDQRFAGLDTQAGAPGFHDGIRAVLGGDQQRAASGQVFPDRPEHIAFVVTLEVALLEVDLFSAQSGEVGLLDRAIGGGTQQELFGNGPLGLGDLDGMTTSPERQQEGEEDGPPNRRAREGVGTWEWFHRGSSYTANVSEMGVLRQPEVSRPG